MNRAHMILSDSHGDRDCAAKICRRSELAAIEHLMGKTRVRKLWMLVNDHVSSRLRGQTSALHLADTNPEAHG
jgi:hypothetical protein